MSLAAITSQFSLSQDLGLTMLGWAIAPASTSWNRGRLGQARLLHPAANAEVTQATPDWTTEPTSTCETGARGDEPGRG